MSSSSDARGPVELLADGFVARCNRGEEPQKALAIFHRLADAYPAVTEVRRFLAHD